MEWYWWVLIIAGVAVIGFLKIKVWNSIQKRRQQKHLDQTDDKE